MKERGVTILVAECKEKGYLEEAIEYTLDDFLSKDPMDLISFYAMKRHRLFLVSSIGGPVFEKLGVRTFTNFKDALREAMLEVGVDSKVIVIPKASIIPKLL
jgi:nickel-dependent lactate racemase